MATKEIQPFQIAQLNVVAAPLTVTLNLENLEALRTEVSRLLEGFSTTQLAIDRIEVQDDESYQICIDLRNDVGKRESALTKIWKRLKDPLNTARNAVLELEHQTVDPFTMAKGQATKKAERFLLEQKKAKALAEEQLKRMAKTEQVSLQDKANDLEAQGYMKEADRVRQQATMTVAPQLPSAIPVAAGARVGDKFTGTVVDLMAVLKSIVDGKTELMWEVSPGDLRPLVVLDQVVLNAIVKRLQAGLRIPGIVVEEGVRISTGRKS